MRRQYSNWNYPQCKKDWLMDMMYSRYDSAGNTVNISNPYYSYQQVSSGSTQNMPMTYQTYLTTTVTPPTVFGNNTITVTTTTGDTDCCDGGYDPADEFRVKDGQKRTITLPDGTVIRVETDGSFVIDDKDAKRIYRANRVLNFNKYVNASDVLEDFIKFCKEQHVKKSEFLKLPVDLFIMWLILEAAKADGEEAPEEVKLVSTIQRFKLPKCLACGRFVPHKHREQVFEFCNGTCFNTYTKRLEFGQKKAIRHGSNILTMSQESRALV